jgi:arylsulfatase A-like enzyme
VHWADKQISRFVDALQQSNRWDETVFVVTADHGEEFLENGARYHSPVNLPERLIHVPLIVHAPGLSGLRISQRPFSVIHLAPTLLEAVGAEVPHSFQGKNCWGQISGGNLPEEPAIAECIEACNNPLQVADRIRPRLMAIRDRDYKLVIRFSDRADFFYDLKNDPGEKSPVPAGVLTAERARFWQAAGAHLEKTRKNRNDDFALRARLYELRQSMGTKREPIPTNAG